MKIDKIHHYTRIKDLREDADVNQTTVAKALNIKQQQYSEYERGLREIPFHRAIEIAEYYNVSLDYIAGRTKCKNINKCNK